MSIVGAARHSPEVHFLTPLPARPGALPHKPVFLAADKGRYKLFHDSSTPGANFTFPSSLLELHQAIIHELLLQQRSRMTQEGEEIPSNFEAGMFTNER